jgi:hypothetical protein
MKKRFRKSKGSVKITAFAMAVMVGISALPSTGFVSNAASNYKTIAMIMDADMAAASEIYEGAEYNVTVEYDIIEGKIANFNATSTAASRADKRYFQYAKDAMILEGVDASKEAIQGVLTDGESGATYSEETIRKAAIEALETVPPESESESEQESESVKESESESKNESESGNESESESESEGEASKEEINTYLELQTALSNAEAGDTITLTKDLEVDPSEAKIGAVTDVTTGATLTITADNVTVDGAGHTIYGKGYPSFDIDGAKNVTVKNITIDGAAYSAKLGGAIFVEDGAVAAFDNITVQNCSANLPVEYNGGGAIYVNKHGSAAPTLTVTNSTFKNNVSKEGVGGAIYVSTGNLNASGNTFISNKAANGGAIGMDGEGTVNITNNTFNGNDAVYSGGALYAAHGQSTGKKNMTINSNVRGTISGNTYSENKSGLTSKDVVYGRFYDGTYVGDKSEVTVSFGDVYEDVTYAYINRKNIFNTANDTVEVNGHTYYYGKSESMTVSGNAVTGTQIGTTGIYYYTQEEPIGEIYGVVPMTYAEYYYGEVNNIDLTPPINAFARKDPSSSLDVQGKYDAVTSATNTNSHWSDVPTILDKTSEEVHSINFISKVDVKVDASLYGQAMVLKAAGYDIPLAVTAAKIDVCERPANTNNVKTLLIDGSYSKAMEIPDNVLRPVAAASSSYSYNSNYGDVMFQVNFNPAGYGEDYVDYMNEIYAVNVIDSSGNKYGAVHWEDIWSQAGRKGYIQVALTEGTVNARGNEFVSTRFTNIFDESKDALIPGTYNYEVKAYGYADQVGSFTVGTALKEDEKVTVEGVVWKNGGVTLDAVMTLPALADLSTASYTVSKGSGRTAVPLGSEDFSFDTATKKLTIHDTEATGIGSYTFTVECAGYQSASAKFTLLSSLKEDQAAIEKNKKGEWVLKIDNSDVNPEAYVAAITGVAVDGVTLRNVKGNTIFIKNEEGNFIVNFDATYENRGTSGETTTLPVFSEGSEREYTLTLTAAAYETITKKVGEVPETEPETEPESETEVETEPESETEIETEPESETEVETELESETEVETETESETEVETESESETEVETETESEKKPETEPETEPVTEPNTEAESGTGTTADELSLVDSVNGIKVTYIDKDLQFPKEAKLEVKTLENSEVTLDGNLEVIKYYEIDVKVNDSIYALKGDVSVKIPVTASSVKNNNVKVYYIGANGNEEMSSSYAAGTVTYTTSHFSKYAIATTKAAPTTNTGTPGTTTTPSATKTKTPSAATKSGIAKTGDNSQVLALIVLSVGTIGIFGAVYCSRKQKVKSRRVK